MLRITLKSHSTICIFTRSHKKMWVSYVNGTPKMSQIGSLIYGISQVHLGPKTRKEKSHKLMAGVMVATYQEDYSSQWPQIGKVKEVNTDSTLTLQWYTGTTTSPWQPLNVPVKGQRGVRCPWEETVQLGIVILPPFQLTAGDKLPCSIVNSLKEKRDEYLRWVLADIHNNELKYQEYICWCYTLFATYRVNFVNMWICN